MRPLSLKVADAEKIETSLIKLEVSALIKARYKENTIVTDVRTTADQRFGTVWLGRCTIRGRPYNFAVSKGTDVKFPDGALRWGVKRG